MPPSAFKDFTVTYRAGERIFSEGEKGAEFFVVQKGRVEIFREQNNNRKPLAHMEKGDFFGELSVLLDVPRAENAEALEKCELIVINSTVFDQMIRSNIEIAVRILRKLSLRLLETTQKLQGLQGAASAEDIDAPPAATMTAEEEPVPPPEAASEAEAVERNPLQGAYLETEDGEQQFTLKGDTLTIGRFDPVTGLKPEVDLSSVDINRSVSRRHAKLQLENGVYQVSEEVGALNGTLVNDRRLVPGKPSPLDDGDTIHFGMVQLTFHNKG